MLNSEDANATRTAVWSEIPELQKRGGRGRFHVTDAWTDRDLGCVDTKYEVELEAHDVAVLVVHGSC